MAQNLELRIKYKDENAPKIVLDVQRLIIETEMNVEEDNAIVSFSIKDDGVFSDAFEYNEVAQHGKIKQPMPLEIFQIKNEDGTLNFDKVNQVIQGFNPNLEIDQDYYKNLNQTT